MDHIYIARLKTRYEEASSEGPDAKTVTFSNIHDQFQLCNPAGISTQPASKLIKEAFPQSHSKKCGAARSLYIFGTQPAGADSAGASQMDTTGETEVSIAREQEKSLMLLEKLQQLQLNIRELEEKNQEMQSRIDKLEEQTSAECGYFDFTGTANA